MHVIVLRRVGIRKTLEFKLFAGRDFAGVVYCCLPAPIVEQFLANNWAWLIFSKWTNLKERYRQGPYSSQNQSVVFPILSPANRVWHMPSSHSHLPSLTWQALGGNGIIIPEEAVRSMNPKLWIWATIVSLNSGPVCRRVRLIFNQALSVIRNVG